MSRGIIRRTKRQAKRNGHLGRHIRQDRWMRRLWRVARQQQQQ